MNTSAQNKKYNVCGVLVSVNSDDFSELLNTLSVIKGCDVIEHDGKNKIALVIEDQHDQSAYDIMESIKDDPKVLSITLINHFFE